jgi:hypothetical protein
LTSGCRRAGHALAGWVQVRPNSRGDDLDAGAARLRTGKPVRNPLMKPIQLIGNQIQDHASMMRQTA